MNRIQQLSRDIETQRLKLQMGIDPSVDIDHRAVREMWQALNYERFRACVRKEFNRTGAGSLPREPAFVDELQPPGP